MHRGLYLLGLSFLLVLESGCVRVAQHPPSLEEIRAARQQFPPLVEPLAVASESARATEHTVLRPQMAVDTLSDEIAMALGRIGPEAVPALVNALEDQDPDVRYHATIALAYMGPQAQVAVPALTAALEDPVRRVRGGAARALGQIGPAATSAIPALVQALHADEASESPAAAQPALWIEAEPATGSIPHD